MPEEVQVDVTEAEKKMVLLMDHINNLKKEMVRSLGMPKNIKKNGQVKGN